MVDGVVLLVDASEGPLPQTRFVLRKTLQARLPVVLVINKTDRQRRQDRRGRRRDLRALPRSRRQRRPDRVPHRLLLVARRPGQPEQARERRDARQREPRAACSTPCCEAIPAPTYTEGAPLQAQVTNIDASLFLGRIGMCRVRQGTITKGQQVAWCRRDGTIVKTKISELLMTEALDRIPVNLRPGRRPDRGGRHRRDHHR